MCRYATARRPTQAIAKDINHCSLSELASLEYILKLSHSLIIYDYKIPEFSADHLHTDFYVLLYMLLVTYLRDPHKDDGVDRRGRSPRGISVILPSRRLVFSRRKISLV
jgi:hypothetical protein